MEREAEFRRLRSDLAALRLMAGLAKLELKYREDQARVPKGESGAGRFAGEHGAGRSRAPAFVAPLAAAATRAAAMGEAGAIAGAGGAAALVGVMGGAMLGLTGDSRPQAHPLPQTSRQAGAPPPEPSPKGHFEEECDEQYDEDIVQCQAGAAMYAKGPKSRKQIYAICERAAEQRRSECLRGGVSATRTPPYPSHLHFSPEPKR